jgi:hypothetical protein
MFDGCLEAAKRVQFFFRGDSDCARPKKLCQDTLRFMIVNHKKAQKTQKAQEEILPIQALLSFAS